MAGKRYVAIRPFRQTDPKTGEDTHYVGDKTELYTGPMNLTYLLDPKGPDGKGPLIGEVEDAPSGPSAAANDDTTKGGK